jgi:hypothetical protein
MVNLITFTTYDNIGGNSGTPFVFGFTDKSQNNDFDNTGTSTEADLEIPPPPPPGDGAGNPISTSYIDSMYVKVNDGTNDINAYQYFIDISDNSDISLNLAVRDYGGDNVVFKYNHSDISGVLGTLNITNDSWTIDLVDASVSGTGPSVTENGDERTVTLPHLGNDLFYTMNLKQYVADSGPTEFTQTISLGSGWNMIGSGNNTTFTENSNIVSSFYNFSSGGYSTSLTMDAYKGYFVRASSATTLNITTYHDTNSITINLSSGWNMISTIYDSTVQDDNNILVSSFYNFNSGGYSTSTDLDAFKGYFIRASGVGSIILNKK